MPPRYAYWTILIDASPTAFRARDREELLPTVHQLRRTNTNVDLKWFAHGRLWENPEQAQWAQRNARKAVTPARGPDWRPGGAHKDPRARFASKRKASGAPGEGAKSTRAGRVGPKRSGGKVAGGGRPPKRPGGPRKPRG